MPPDPVDLCHAIPARGSIEELKPQRTEAGRRPTDVAPEARGLGPATHLNRFSQAAFKPVRRGGAPIVNS